jgi:hypothetical protein
MRQKTADTFESLRQPGSMGSQPHAAVGDLVRILRSAPRLQQLSAPSETFSDLASGKLVMGSPQVPGSTHTSPLGIPVGSLGMGKVKGIPPKSGATGMPNLNSGGHPEVDACFGSVSPSSPPGSGWGSVGVVDSPPPSLEYGLRGL